MRMITCASLYLLIRRDDRVYEFNGFANAQAHSGTYVVLAHDLELRTNHAGSLPHPLQTVLAALCSTRYVETDTVVVHGNVEAIVAAIQDNVHMRRLRMTAHVGQRLLYDAKHRARMVVAQRRFTSA